VPQPQGQHEQPNRCSSLLVNSSSEICPPRAAWSPAQS
jgi:hypothetical protein